MTVVCQYCQKVIREKCPKCGAEAEKVEGGWRCVNVAIVPPHVTFFTEGAGGISHGVCCDCHKIVEEEMALWKKETTNG